MLQLILFIAVLVFIVYYTTYKPRAYPPGPFRIPLIGCILSVDSERPYNTYANLCKQYGQVLGLYIGNNPVVVVNGWDAVVEGIQDKKLIRGETLAIKEAYYGKCLGIIFNNGLPWKVQRRFALFHLNKLGFGKKSNEDIAHEEIQDLITEMKNQKEKPFSISIPFTISFLNILWAVVGGERFSRGDKNLETIMELMHKAVEVGEVAGGIIDSFPFLRYVIPKLSGYENVLQGFRGIGEFVKVGIEEHKKNFDPNDCRGFIDVFLKEMKSSNSDPSFTDEQLIAVCMDFFFAGTETGSSLLTFTILFLCLFPEKQLQIQKEIDEHVVTSRLPEIADRSKLHYTDAFLNEVFRLRAPAPFTALYCPAADTTLQGHRIPKDTGVLFNIRSVLMEEDYWGDPETFRPERFLQDGVFQKNERLIGFGKGSRSCPGEIFGRNNSFLIFSAMVQNFNFEFPIGEMVKDTDGTAGITLRPPAFNIIARPRMK